MPGASRLTRGPRTAGTELLTSFTPGARVKPEQLNDLCSGPAQTGFLHARSGSENVPWDARPKWHDRIRSPSECDGWQVQGLGLFGRVRFGIIPGSGLVAACHALVAAVLTGRRLIAAIAAAGLA